MSQRSSRYLHEKEYLKILLHIRYVKLIKDGELSMYNGEKLKKLAEDVRKQTEKYNLPTTPKRKKKNKKTE
jgi:hypothetical protein